MQIKNFVINTIMVYHNGNISNIKIELSKVQINDIKIHVFLRFILWIMKTTDKISIYLYICKPRFQQYQIL
jgi:hypothetical protein